MVQLKLKLRRQRPGTVVMYFSDDPPRGILLSQVSARQLNDTLRRHNWIFLEAHLSGYLLWSVERRDVSDMPLPPAPAPSSPPCAFEDAVCAPAPPTAQIDRLEKFLSTHCRPTGVTAVRDATTAELLSELFHRGDGDVWLDMDGVLRKGHR